MHINLQTELRSFVCRILARASISWPLHCLSSRKSIRRERKKIKVFTAANWVDDHKVRSSYNLNYLMAPWRFSVIFHIHALGHAGKTKSVNVVVCLIGINQVKTTREPAWCCCVLHTPATDSLFQSINILTGRLTPGELKNELPRIN